MHIGGHCEYCDQPVPENERFCSEACAEEYASELACFLEDRDSLPGESSHAGEHEVEEWDVVGGL